MAKVPLPLLEKAKNDLGLRITCFLTPIISPFLLEFTIGDRDPIPLCVAVVWGITICGSLGVWLSAKSLRLKRAAKALFIGCLVILAIFGVLFGLFFWWVSTVQD